MPPPPLPYDPVGIMDQAVDDFSSNSTDISFFNETNRSANTFGEEGCSVLCGSITDPEWCSNFLLGWE